MRHLRTALVLLFLLTATSVSLGDEGAGTKLAVADALTFALPRSGATSAPVSFLVFNQDEDIAELEVTVVDIQGPDGRSLASPSEVTAAARARPVRGERSFLVSLTLRDEAFDAPGDHRVTLRLSGFGGAAPDAGAASTKAVATRFTSVVLHRPALDPVDTRALTLRLERATPFSAASGRLRHVLRPGAGSSLSGCTVSVGTVHEKSAAEGARGALASGTIAPVAPGCASGTVELKLDGFDTAGEFTGALLVSAPGLGEDPVRIPLEIQVTDAVWGPLLAILLGVAIALAVDVGAQAWRAEKEQEIRLHALRAEIERRRLITEEPELAAPLASLGEQLAQAEASRDRKDRLDAVEKELEVLGDKVFQKRAELAARLEALRKRLPSPGDSALPDAAARSLKEAHAGIEEASRLLNAGRTRSAEEKLQGVESSVTAAPPDSRRAARPTGPQAFSVDVVDEAPWLAILDDSREAGSTLSFAIRPEARFPGKGLKFLWEFGDGSNGKETGIPQAQHRFSAGGRYTVKVSIVDDKGAQLAKLETPCNVRASSAARRASAARAQLYVMNGVLFLIAALVATLTALTALYFNGKPFGAWPDYIGAVLWGFGTDASLRRIGFVVSALQSGSGRERT
ncbi:PKD domain-containing protein [Sorangium sp. So ce429]